MNAKQSKRVVLFSDIRGFTSLTAKRGDREAYRLVKTFVRLVEEQVELCNVSAFMSVKPDFDKHHFPTAFSLDGLPDLPNIITGGLTERWANEDPFLPKRS